MDPKARNRVLMVGGAVVLVALLLVCGPLEGRFGEQPPLPPVAAAPPLAGLEDIASIAAEGASAGAAIGGTALSEAAEPVDDGAALPVAGAAVASAAPAAEGAASSAGGGGSAAAPVPPPVSSGSGTSAAAAAPAPTAAEAFDASMADAGGPVGIASDRFPPPVSSGPSALAVASAQGFDARDGTLRRPCDSPGGTCRSLRGASGANFVPPPRNGLSGGSRPGSR